MAWSASGAFRQTLADALNNVAAVDLGLETHRGALFGNSVTPDFDATAANTAYNAGTWTTGNEVSGTGYTAAGALLTTTTVSTVSGGIVMWDADDLTWSTATITAYGVLLYEDARTTPVADQGILAVYFGGAVTSTAGLFTVQWSANGIWRIDVA